MSVAHFGRNWILRLVLIVTVVATVDARAGRPAGQQGPGPAMATRTGAMSGIVVDARTEQPVPGAVVSLAGLLNARQVTDGQGRFVFRDLPPSDSYRISASAVGYLGSGVGREGSHAERIQLSDGQWLRDVRVALWPPAFVGGTVADEAGEPVAGAYVAALRLTHVAGYTHAVVGPTTRSDDRGEYGFTLLPKGEYVVLVRYLQPSDSAEILPARAPAQGDRALVYPPTFHQSARTLAEARSIAVDFGDEHRGVDVLLQPGPAFSVSGVIQGLRSSAQGLTLRLVLSGNEGFAGGETATADVARDGRFQLRGVPAGSYTLHAAPVVSSFRFFPPPGLVPPGVMTRLPAVGRFRPGSLVGIMSEPGADTFLVTERASDAPPQWGRTSVEVFDRDLFNVVLTVAAGRTLAGRIDCDTGECGRGPVAVRAEPCGPDAGAGSPHVIVPGGDPGGSFTLEGLTEGRYWLSASAVGPAPVVVRSIQWSGQDYTDRPFDTALGLEFVDVVVTLTTNVSRIVGSVHDRSLTPVAGATVVYFPSDRELWGEAPIHPRRMGAVSTRKDGTYTAGPLPGGDYYVIAIPASPDTSWQTPEWFDTASRTAVRIAVRWGETRVQNLSVQQVATR